MEISECRPFLTSIKLPTFPIHFCKFWRARRRPKSWKGLSHTLDHAPYNIHTFNYSFITIHKNCLLLSGPWQNWNDVITAWPKKNGQNENEIENGKSCTVHTKFIQFLGFVLTRSLSNLYKQKIKYIYAHSPASGSGRAFFEKYTNILGFPSPAARFLSAFLFFS